MKGLLILIAVIVLMAVGGWLTFSNTGHCTSVTIETEKIERDTRSAVQNGADALSEAAEKIGDEVKIREEPSTRDSHAPGAAPVR